MKKLKKLLLKYFPVHKFRHNLSYSQEGEDMVLLGFYEGRKNYKGFYVDVGAHHPYRFSNTNTFYKRGWRGINIEPNPDAMKWFKLLRRGDKNLNVGVAEQEGVMEYYCFNESALNGFSKAVSEQRHQHTPYSIQKTISVPILRLDQILDEHVRHGTQIDFLSIDAEGYDLQVLKSNNWAKYRPTYVLVEDIFDMDSGTDTPVVAFLRENGYGIVAKTKRTLFFTEFSNDYFFKR